MPAAKDLNPFDNPFGYAVRRHRLRLGLTQEQLGKRIGYSGDAVGKFEKGDVAPSIELARACDEVFGTHGDMEQLHELVRHRAAFPSWFRRWPEEIEPNARTIRKWQPLVVDGLIQTPGYARELLALHPGMTDPRIEELVAARMDRQKVLDREEPPQLRIVLYEGVLHYQVGDAKIMHDQLRAIIEAAQRPHITIQVVPTSGAVHSGMNGSFAIASLNGAPDVVYLENARAGQVVDRSEDVQAIADIWEAIRQETLPVSASLDLVAKVMEQWT